MHTAIVSQFEIAALEPDALTRFYALLFGWRLGTEDAGNRKLLVVPTERNGIGGSVKTAAQVKSGGLKVIVEVDDVFEHVCYAEELGGRIIELPHHEITSGGRRLTVASFADPEGNRVGLSEGHARPAA